MVTPLITETERLANRDSELFGSYSLRQLSVRMSQIKDSEGLNLDDNWEDRFNFISKTSI